MPDATISDPTHGGKSFSQLPAHDPCLGNCRHYREGSGQLPGCGRADSCGAGQQLGRALTRFSRLLRNPRIDEQLLTAQLLQRLGHGQQRLIALDWTEWHHDLRMLVAAVVVGCRAIPVQAAAFSKKIPRSQNLRETTFLRLLVHTLRTAEQAAVVLCDRGFRRVRWLAHLQELRQAFVVRLVPDVMVTTGSCGARLLRTWHLHPGQVVDLGMVHLRQDRAVQVRVVGVWAPNSRSPGG